MISLTQRNAGISWITSSHLMLGKINSHQSKNDTCQDFDVRYYQVSGLYPWTYFFPVVRYSPGDSSTRPQKEFITHVFFPFRFVEYKGDSQFTEGHPDNTPISKETPADEARLDSLIQFLKERGGVLERDMVTFTYMKELHPSVDWRNVSSLFYWFSSQLTSVSVLILSRFYFTVLRFRLFFPYAS